MRVTTSQPEPFTVSATVTLESGETAGYLEEVRATAVREVTVQGFRKGTAPRHLADRELNDAAVRAEALELALGDSFTKAATQEQWDVQSTSDLKVIRNDAAGLEYSVTVRLWPAVALPDLATLSVPAKPVEVSDAEIAEAVDTVRGLRATFTDKEGSAAQGDRVEVDFDASVGGALLEGGSARNHALMIGGKSFMPGFEEQLVGMTPGEKKEFSVKAPDDYGQEAVAGKTVDFSVTLHKVQAVHRPEADDAFAQSLGSFKDMGELTATVRDGIRREKEAKEANRRRLAILDAIIAKTDIPAPKAMTDAELDFMVSRFSADLQSRGIAFPMYLTRLNRTEEQFRAEWRPEAERQVRISLILRAVTRAQGITAPEAGEPEAQEQAVREGALRFLEDAVRV